MKSYPTRLDMIAALPRGAIGAEIGVQRGEFAAQILSTPVFKLYLVDAWAPIPGADPRDPANITEGGHESNYKHVLGRFLKEIAAQCVVVHRGLSAHIAARFPDGSLDFVYIDAGHGFKDVTTDLNEWSRKISLGGCIMGHDYTDAPKAREMGFQVVRAVDEWSRLNNWKLTALTWEEWPSFKLERK